MYWPAKGPEKTVFVNHRCHSSKVCHDLHAMTSTISLFISFAKKKKKNTWGKKALLAWHKITQVITQAVDVSLEQRCWLAKIGRCGGLARQTDHKVVKCVTVCAKASGIYCSLFKENISPIEWGMTDWTVKCWCALMHLPQVVNPSELFLKQPQCLISAALLRIKHLKDMCFQYTCLALFHFFHKSPCCPNWLRVSCHWHHSF